MSQIIAIVLLSGASCVSHIDQSDALKVTLASKTPCAVVIREPIANPFKAAQQSNTITPAAATKPPTFKYPPKKKSKKKRKKR